MDRLNPPAEDDLQGLIRAAAAHHAAGRWDHAEACYRRIVTMVPTWAEAFSNRGCVLWDRGNSSAAVECYERAIALDPTSARAHFNLGFAFQRSGRSDAAAQCYRQAVMLDPNHAAAHSALGVIDFERRQLPAAVEHFRRAIAIDPTSAEHRHNLGLALEDQGHLDDAADAFRQAIALNPRFAEAHYNLSQLKRFREKDGDFQLLEHCAGQADSLDTARRPLVHFALAKAYDDLAEYAHAFVQLQKGNQQKRRLVQYDPGEVERRVDRIIELFTAQRMQRAGGYVNLSDVPIFVVGMPRSGSTLVEQILSSHPQIQGGGELTLLPRMVSGGRDRNGEPLNEADFFKSALDNPRVMQHLAKLYLDGLPVLQTGRHRLTDKLPANFFNIGLIHLMLPCATIIHTVRDPLDTCFSCYSTLFSSGIAYSYDLRELGRHHRAYAKLMDHWRSVLPPGVMLEVRYESLVADTENVARGMIEHCRLPWDASCLQFQANPRQVGTASKHQIRRPIYADSIGRARRYEAWLQPLLDELR